MLEAYEEIVVPMVKRAQWLRERLIVWLLCVVFPVRVAQLAAMLVELAAWMADLPNTKLRI